MNLYKVERDAKNVSYDDFIWYIICAENLTSAQNIIESWDLFFDIKEWEIIPIELIWTADKSIPEWIVFNSFKSG
jgi:hypothetical protein